MRRGLTRYAGCCTHYETDDCIQWPNVRNRSADAAHPARSHPQVARDTKPAGGDSLCYLGQDV